MLKRLVLATVLMCVGICGTETATAQDLKSQLLGAWTLVSLVNTRADGSQFEPYGPHVTGMMTLLPTGHFTITILRPDLPKYAANNRLQGTPEEYQATVQGSLAYFGRYTVDGETLTLQIETSTYPNWNGETQTRPIALMGDRLEMQTPAATLGGRSVLRWKRVQ
jgi:hypothetical protein